VNGKKRGMSTECCESDCSQKRFCGSHHGLLLVIEITVRKYEEILNEYQDNALGI
jgi:hypothetical protein